ncbi:hypothetical protein NADFUDRAFT_53668 [Nadsonia fulvescens var. elongata DSM 6958]|uniref:Uncharacterized protein n=1 Tax=Nadsonia fulvescens var. elongata DSM 6958 TaxID=857566 RepID=A0A1E3PDA5_9ASCO|nr:hypothetical protein NADFUDRAFT_53668 [Nadsonia fulvescens var. elongata DSM 6958]
MDKPDISARMRELVMLAWYQFDKSRSGTVSLEYRNLISMKSRNEPLLLIAILPNKQIVASEILQLIEAMERVLRIPAGSLISPETVTETRKFCESQPDLIIDIDCFIVLFNQLTDDYLYKEAREIEAVYSEVDQSINTPSNVGLGLMGMEKSLQNERIMSTPVNGLSMGDLKQKLDSYDTQTGIFDDLPRLSDVCKANSHPTDQERPSKLKLAQERRRRLQNRLSSTSPTPLSLEKVYEASNGRSTTVDAMTPPPSSHGNDSIGNDNKVSHLKKLINEKDAQIENYESQTVSLQDANALLTQQLGDMRRTVTKLQHELIELHHQVTHADQHCRQAQIEAARWRDECERMKFQTAAQEEDTEKQDSDDIEALRNQISSLSRDHDDQTKLVESMKSNTKTLTTELGELKLQLSDSQDKLNEANAKLVTERSFKDKLLSQVTSRNNSIGLSPISDTGVDFLTPRRLTYTVLKRLSGAVDRQRELARALARGQARVPSALEFRNYCINSLPLVGVVFGFALLLAILKMTSVLVRNISYLVTDETAHLETAKKTVGWLDEYRLNPMAIGDKTANLGAWWSGSRFGWLETVGYLVDDWVRDSDLGLPI